MAASWTRVFDKCENMARTLVLIQLGRYQPSFNFSPGALPAAPYKIF